VDITAYNCNYCTDSCHTCSTVQQHITTVVQFSKECALVKGNYEQGFISDCSIHCYLLSTAFSLYFSPWRWYDRDWNMLDYQSIVSTLCWLIS